MENEQNKSNSDETTFAIYQLASRVVGVLGSIILLGVLTFIVLLIAYLYMMIDSSASNFSSADSFERIEDLMFRIWDKLVPIGESILRIVSPVIILLIALLALRIFNRSGVSTLDFRKITSDLPSVLALLIVATICLLPLAGLSVPEVLSNVALVVVGFYFGRRDKEV